MSYDLVIVGGGPAGASAAVFAARAGLSTLVVDADKGVTRRAMLHNHLGFPDGITGPELVDLGRRHAETAGADWREDSVEALEATDDGLALTTESGERIEARDVLLASGMSTKLAEAAGIATTPGTEPRIATILAIEHDGRTSQAGVWAAGTVAGTTMHTVVTAGDGARVAVNIISAQKGERWVDHDVLPKPE